LTIFLLICFFVFYALSTPYVSALLLYRMGRFNPLDPESDISNAGAIVILAADSTIHMPEFGCHTVGPLSLERIRYGAWLHRRTGLPILVAGGPSNNAALSLAELCRTTLVDEFNVPVRWIESESMNTFEHAQKVPEILAVDGIEEVLLVTHAFHMRRAVAAFEYSGQKVIPAPTIFARVPTPLLTDFYPGPRWLLRSYYTIYESLALVWYRYHYFRMGVLSFFRPS